MAIPGCSVSYFAFGMSQNMDKHITALREISSISLKLKEFVGNCNIPEHLKSPGDDRCITTPTLKLPHPQEVFTTLLSSGLPQHVINEGYARLMQWSEEFQELYSKHFEQASRKLLALPQPAGSLPIELLLERLRCSYEESLAKRHMSIVKAQLALQISSAQARQCEAIHQNGKSHKRVPFNNEYTPFLEEYFEYNAYPSPRDRDLLARKSMMTTRQIDVWFQNHRNRAKKEGKTLRRLTTNPLPSCIPLDSLKLKMPTFTVSEDRMPKDAKLEEIDNLLDPHSTSAPRTHTLLDVLNPPAPSHAFPAIYPPECQFNPFPCKTGVYTCSAPIWPRKPSTASPLVYSSVDVDVLILDFASRLNLHGNSPKRQPIGQSSSPGNQPWFAWRVTIPPPAPHPALLLHRPRESSQSLLNVASLLSNSHRSPSRHRPSCKVTAHHRYTPFIRRTPVRADNPSPPPLSRSSSMSSISSSESFSAHLSTPSTSANTTPASSPKAVNTSPQLPSDSYPFDLAVGSFITSSQFGWDMFSDFRTLPLEVLAP